MGPVIVTGPIGVGTGLADTNTVAIPFRHRASIIRDQGRTIYMTDRFELACYGIHASVLVF
jgi:hypothetical protein